MEVVSESATEGAEVADSQVTHLQVCTNLVLEHDKVEARVKG